VEAKLEQLLPCGWEKFWQFMLNGTELQPIGFRFLNFNSESARSGICADQAS
jgi:hypothetical protein